MVLAGYITAHPPQEYIPFPVRERQCNGCHIASITDHHETLACGYRYAVSGE